jgi:hypothetical protein
MRSVLSAWSSLSGPLPSIFPLIGRTTPSVGKTPSVVLPSVGPAPLGLPVGPRPFAEHFLVAVLIAATLFLATDIADSRATGILAGIRMPLRTAQLCGILSPEAAIHEHVD